MQYEAGLFLDFGKYAEPRQPFQFWLWEIGFSETP
jgi:hypothetical protein